LMGLSWEGKRRFFHFYIFQNRFLQKYIFGFTIYRFVPLPPGRGAAAPLPGGMGLYAIKISVLSQQTPPNIKAEVPPGPPHLHLQQTTSIEGKMRDVG